MFCVLLGLVDCFGLVALPFSFRLGLRAWVLVVSFAVFGLMRYGWYLFGVCLVGLLLCGLVGLLCFCLVGCCR